MIKLCSIFFLLALIHFSNCEYLKTEEKILLRDFQWEEISTAVLTSNDTENLCLDSLKNYKKGIDEGQEWALYMLDSSTKIPNGILYGNSFFLGQFDECIQAQNENFTGQYCLADITIQLQLTSQKKYNRPQFLSPVITAEGLAESMGLNWHYGLCFPSTCTAEQLTNLITEGLSFMPDKYNFVQNFTFSESNCRTSKSKELSTGFWIVIAFIIVIVILALASTSYEIYHCKKGNDKLHPLSVAFSLYRNGKYLFKTSNRDGQMSSLHGMRSLSIAWVILGHAYYMCLYAPVVNPKDFLTIIQDINKIFIINAVVSVDSFFLLSGLLVCFVFFRDIGRKGGYDVPLGYIHRYVRLTPLYALMILILVTIFEYLGNGPIWNYISIPYINKCNKSWYYGLLYVQNYMSPNSTCLGQTWYLSVDMQLYWVAPLILYPMLLLPPSIGAGFILVVILGWVGLTAGLDYENKTTPSIFLAMGSDQVWLDYEATHTRAGPWLVGLALGYLIAGVKAEKIKINLSKGQVLLGWICSAAVCLGVLYGIKPFLDIPSTRSQAEMAAYMPLHRLGWALGLSWVIFACVNGYGGPVNTFLSWKIFQPLGKLSYCVFLVQMSIQWFRVGSLRTNVYAGDLEVVYHFLADYILANLISIPFVLLFEIPIANLNRYFFADVEIFQYPRKKKELILTTRKTEEKAPKLSFTDNNNNEEFGNRRPNLNLISVLDIDKELSDLERKKS